jgi:cyclic beta-1,2-glucan synthetase
LALRSGIPEESRTLVVVPVIIDTEARVLSLFHDLEVRYLANPDPHLHFALLTDFPDALERVTPADERVLGAAVARVDELNERHGAGRFFLFHRERRWNPSESRWMGWERKRGKLAELNRLLRGADDTSFVVQHGERSILPAVRYVITLDSDTQLPIDSARRLVGTISHPLNRPRFDHKLGRVTEGYGVLQPRVGVGLESANRTTFALVFSGHVGIDPYTSAVSDVYQDLFHEGNFVGKGIYDVDAFTAALEGRVPENCLLSHDLFEGFYARTGLTTDIHVVDDYPSNYLAFAARLHRWVRGDWQILRWLWLTVPDATGRHVRNTLPVISRWKILDNLRRSLLPPALTALFVAGWTTLPGSTLVWSALAALVLAYPAYVQVGRSLSSRIRGVPLREHVLAERDTLITSARQVLLSAVFLLHQSWVMLDAIGRTLVRMLVTRRRLLEWVTADRTSHVQAFAGTVFRRMALTPAVAACLAALVAWIAPTHLPLALPLIALWFASPALAYATGLPVQHRRAAPGKTDRREWRRIARRTWRYFDDLVGVADNSLVPDNLQENRADHIAHRTSPTNIGLQLLSMLAARDFGYLTTSELLNRLEPTFQTLLRLERYRGHFFNWYDTRTLDPLPPEYISTVDSGNLAGYLLTLRAGLASLADAPIIDGSALEAIGDDIDWCEEELARALGDERVRPSARSIKREFAGIRALLQDVPGRLPEWHQRLNDLRERIAALGVLLHELEEPHLTSAPTASPLADASHAFDKAAAHVAARQEELQRLAGWASMKLPASIEAPLSIPSSWQLMAWTQRALQTLQGEINDAVVSSALHKAATTLADHATRAERLGALADDLVEETEFGFLFNTDRQLFSIGFNVAEGRLDPSHYDTLASEARLASFVAIATGRVPHEHWFKLGRSLTPSGTSRALLSWSASMFEYLMPLLVMRAYPNTLLAETYDAVVSRQIKYGAQRGVPWGISESAYNVQDLDGNYQYRAFGVPGLGLKRGLADDLVIAPYATLLAAMVAPAEADENLKALRREGLWGAYGYYEAIDYTPGRIQPEHRGVVLPTYMAHHQGMSLLALDDVLHDGPMQRRFHSDPRVQAADLLLQERIPHLVPLKNPPIEKAEHVPSVRNQAAPATRRYTTAHTLSPRTLLLSNGDYAVMLTNAGGGYSRRQATAMTRWREDLTRDNWGSFCFVRDLESGEVWSTTYQPTLKEADVYEVTFAPDRAVYRRIDSKIEIRTEVVVSPEDAAELRRVSITNHSDRARSLDLTTYAEVVLTTHAADIAHPAFSNLFIETTAIPERNALMCVRRPREGTARSYLVHVLSGRLRPDTATEYETDRARFVGRGRTLQDPLAMALDVKLSGTTGPVLDPIVSLRQSIRIPPGGTARLAFATAYAEDEDTARRLIDKYQDRRSVARALGLASTHSQIELRHLSLTAEETLRFQRLAGRMIYADPRLRARDALLTNTRGQAALWKYGISGDLPILLLRIGEGAEVGLFRELLKAHEYLRLKGFSFDLVCINERGVSYLQELQTTLLQLVESSPEQSWLDRPGGVFLKRADLMTEEDRNLLRAAARVDIAASDGNLTAQLQLPHIPREYPPSRPEATTRARPIVPATSSVRGEPAALEFFNGFGGFSNDGQQYAITVNRQRYPRLEPGTLPPAPWTNVVANDKFGFAATECSSGYTWSGNSHHNRLTPWSNDAVRDQPGECLYIRDDDSGDVWSATPLPAGDGLTYTVRHGQGETVFAHRRDDLDSTLTVFVPNDEQVKVFALTLRNDGARARRLSVTLFVEWVLGAERSGSQMHIVTSQDAATGAILAWNRFRQEFSERIAFLDLQSGDRRSITTDRTEFIGRNGTLAMPVALQRASLSGHVGAALDPCGAVQVSVQVAPGDEVVLTGLLGDAGSVDEARATIERLRTRSNLEAALAAARQSWKTLSTAVQVRTPDRAFDLMMNGWLLYQTLACRIWGRSAFYQSSGAYGFRDQLQDVLALLVAAPHLVREHLLRAAAHQFVEGDVQHWWHEPSGRGVRTRFADDRLWLPYAVLEYIGATGDVAVLDEPVPFLVGRQLNPGEHDVYEQPEVTPDSKSLYEHCVRAIALNMAIGVHGLPLIGGGDWNDGMNMVGIEGKGESVWLAWFLAALLPSFADVAESRGDRDLARAYRQHAVRMTDGAERAWDGDWYRRAYFDDGTPLGSSANEECKIDSLAQSWAVIAGTADAARARRAMQSTDEHLVRADKRIVLLLTPPFDRSTPTPGYIQGYLPGVRENGGQYTHAALWTVLAFARLGDGNRALELFSMLNPINHSRTEADVLDYRVEPYVVAADVYSRPPHAGRGGWTWYTGSAGWMYRVGLEGILGLTLRARALHLDPCIPRGWAGYEIDVRPPGAPTATYRIRVDNPDGVNRGVRRIEVDDVAVPGTIVPVVDDGRVHQVRVVLG